MICITLSIHVLSDFIRFHSSSEATRSFFIVGESWWVMLVSHVLPPLTPYSLARLKQQYIHNWWKESERYCQNMSELTYPLQLSAFFFSPQLRPHLQQILLRELCPLTVFHHHLLELIRECVQRLLALFCTGMKISDCTSWYDRTNHKTKRWGSPRIGPTPEKVQGSRNQKMIMIRAKGRMLRHSVWWSNRGSYGSVWTDASKRDTATSPPAWTPTETGCFFLVLLGLAFPR